MVINFIDSIYTLILTYNLIRLYFSKKKKRRKEKETCFAISKRKKRVIDNLSFLKEKKEAISREFRADIKKEKKEARKTTKRHRFYHDCSWNRSAIARREERKDDGERKEGLKVGRERERERGRKDKEGKIKTKACRGGAGRESESRFHYFISKAERCGDNGPPPEGWHDRKPRDISIVSNANSENETWNRWLRTKGNGIAKTIAIRPL